MNSIVTGLCCAVVAAGMTAAAAGEKKTADPLAAYNVVWDSPSKDSGGSMPLGNGEVALNAWVEAEGGLQFLISRTDAWDDNARLVKVGKVRVRLDPNPFADAGKSFRQTLNLRDGTMVVQAGQGKKRTTVRVWVDANRPVARVSVESASPVTATASVELWRTQRQEYKKLQCSDIMNSAPPKQRRPTIIEPDTVLTGRTTDIGWYHHNAKSFGPAILAEIQGLTGFEQPDPLLHRTFGGVIRSKGPAERVDDLHLRTKAGESQELSVYVVARHPSTPKAWLAAVDKLIAATEAKGLAACRAAHEQWWRAFWDRSWIHAWMAPGAGPAGAGSIPANKHAVRVGVDQGGGNRYTGEIGRASVFGHALDAKQIAALAALDHAKPVAKQPGLLWSGQNVSSGPVKDSAGWDLTKGFTVEVWARPKKLPGGGARLLDKITPGGADGFLLDTYPGNSVRFICGKSQFKLGGALPAGKWTHVAAVAGADGQGTLYVGGKPAGPASDGPVKDEAVYVSRMYHLQRFITACQGRGRYPIKFNGGLFTVPLAGGKSDPDYRRWGPGYWWQNTRLPYYAMCAAGDYDLMEPLFRMYIDDLLDQCTYRTKLYCGHGGAFYAECIYFWGPIFSQTYGWQPMSQRKDRLQASRWHKWEWVCGPELCWLALDYYDHTGDADFLRKRLLPLARETVTFFDQHYKTDQAGRLVMHPSQACETWWDCTNPMPELAGLRAVCQRLLGLGQGAVPAADRALFQQFYAKLPALPLREVSGKKALAPAEKYANKRNIENPELYAVFPFRLITVGKPNVDWGTVALAHRWNRGHAGWRQDDIFMAYLGLAQQARAALVSRARHRDRTQRFPAFWGPNYDWTPDQTHGGVLMTTFQAMLMQTDSPQQGSGKPQGGGVTLMPAWPPQWEADFKLHAPKGMVIEGKVRGGKVVDLKVDPPDLRSQITIIGTTREERGGRK